MLLSIPSYDSQNQRCASITSLSHNTKWSCRLSIMLTTICTKIYQERQHIDTALLCNDAVNFQHQQNMPLHQKIVAFLLFYFTCNIQCDTTSSYNWWTSVDHYLTLVHSTIISCTQLWDNIRYLVATQNKWRYSRDSL